MSCKAKKQEATKRMQAELIKEAKVMGRPRHFQSEEHFIDELQGYLEACQNLNNRIPTKAGFARFTNTTVETIMMCEQYFPYGFKKMNDFFQDAIVNCNANKNLMGIFVLKDQHKWQDTSQAGLTINYNNITDRQLETWLKDANLIEAPKDDE